MQIDYSPKTTYEQLVRRIFIHGFTKDGCMESLLSCHPGLPDTLASWMYDCNQLYSNATVYELGFASPKYHASGNSSADVQMVLQEEAALLFKVIQIGKITELASPSSSARTFQERLEAGQSDFSLQKGIELSDLSKMVKSWFELIFGENEKEYSRISTDDRVDFWGSICCDISFRDQRFSSAEIETARIEADY